MKVLAFVFSAAAFPTKGVLELVSPDVEEPFFIGQRDGCRGNFSDFPDVPIRMFRALDGTTTFFDSDSQGFKRSTLAPGNASAWRRDCTPVLSSGNEGPTATPDTYNNSLWIQAAWAYAPPSNSSGTVVALVHNEFHGEKATAHPALCPSGVLARCWYANMQHAVSVDGGATFALAPMPLGASIVSPLRYVPDGGRQGYSTASNIVDKDGYLFVMVSVNPPKGQGAPGVCLWRTANATDPRGWRAWDGSAFSIPSVDPYLEAPQPLCTSVTPDDRFRSSVVYSDTLSTFVAVGLAGGSVWCAFRRGAPPPAPSSTSRRWQHLTPNHTPTDATSDDLIHWSDPAVLKSNITDFSGPGFPRQGYFTLLDYEYAGAGGNFVHISDAPYLYYTRDNAPGQNNRDIVRQRVSVT